MTSIFRKGLVLVAVPLVFQTVFLAVLLAMQQQSAAAERWALHSKEALAQAQASLFLLVQENSRVRGLVLTGDPLFLRGEAARALPAIDKLSSLVTDNPQQLTRVAELRAVARRLEAWTDSLELLVGAARRREAADAVRTLEGEDLLLDAQAVLSTFLREERRLDRERQQRLATTRLRQRILLAVAAVAAAVVAFGMVRLFGREIGSRLAVVTANARRLAEDAPLSPPLGGLDEIAELDEAFHAMAGRLRDAAAQRLRDQEELERRAAELAGANQELGVKNQEIETFVYSVSHDLRSPLVNLQGFSRELDRACEDLRQRLAASELPAETRERLAAIDQEMSESLHFIRTAVARSAGIIDALLRLSRAGRLEHRPQAVDLEVMVRRVVDAMQSTIEQKGARVTVQPLPSAWGDPVALEQIFGNLVSNAVGYLDPGRAGQVEVGVLEGSDGGDGAIEAPRTYFVRDNGRGIPAAYHSKLFIAFQRLHGDSVPGEGIGLTLVRRNVERHNGRVWVESREGAGSTFFVSLPGRGGKL